MMILLLFILMMILLKREIFYIDETSEHYLPELKYLIVRLTESIEEASDIITG